MILTDSIDVGFELCLKYPLLKGYTFKELSASDNKRFQSFLDKVSRMTVQQVDDTFRRQSDKHDVFLGMQVLHYAVTDSFRIHVVLEAGQYKLIRLDPNHKVHS